VLRRLAVLALSWVVVACGGDPGVGVGSVGSNQRSGRFGSLRDFVLVDRDAGLFVDRFEATQADWVGFAATDRGRAVAAGDVSIIGRLSLPVGGMDLLQARAFASWRCGRLPSEREWQGVTEGGGRGSFPWGTKEDATRANTGDLGLRERMPVGTFESGRKAGGDAPYDLIGNVREWTETVPPEWCLDSGPDPSSFSRSLARVERNPSLAAWGDRFGLVPAGLLVASGGPGVPRRCVGADFETQMRFVRERSFDTQAAGERRLRTGLRVYATAAELVERLVGLRGEVDGDERLQLQAFVGRRGHRAALASVAAGLDAASLPARSAGRALLEEVARRP
jgi:formylglycine-generating enzyme required for sulfatase activity